MELAANVGLVVVGVHGLALVQKGLVLLQEGVQVLGLLHAGANIVDGFLEAEEVAAQVLKDGDLLTLLPAGKLAHEANAAHPLGLQSAVEEVGIRAADEVGQGGLAGAVAADEGAVTAGLQGKVNGMV